MWGDRRYNASSALPPAHPGQRMTKSAPCSPVKPLLKPRPPSRADSFHVIHKVPVGDSPYVKAKHVQLVDKEPDKAIALFWAAINAGDRVDSALKDMAIVMKQQNRPEEAIEAIKSLRERCSEQAQESLDNVLLDLYKRCGRLDDQIVLLKHKLELIYAGLAFNGKRTKTARSQGKKFQVSIEQEATRLLGNLGWAYMQQSNFVAAEAVYRKALSMEADNNKVCNLGICLMKQGRLEEAKLLLLSVTPACADPRWGADSHLKSYERAQEMLREMENPEAAQQLQAQAQPQAARSLFASVVSRKLPQQRSAFTVPYDDGEEEEDMLDFEPDETDENTNSNIAAAAAAAAAGLFQDQQQQQQQQQAEALKKRLEILCRSSNNNTSSTNNNSSVAGPGCYPSSNYSPSKPPRCTSRPSSTTRRSLSLGSFDHLQPPGFGLSQQQPPPQQQQQQQLQRAAKLPLVTSNSTSMVVMPTTPSRDQQQQPNVSEIVSMMSSCSFGDLGFIESPKAVDFATPGATGGVNNNRMSSDRCQQRLRVFQDITTAAPSSPLAR